MSFLANIVTNVDVAVNYVSQLLDSIIKNSIYAAMPASRSTPDTVWNPGEIFEEPRQIEYAVVVLNRPVSITKNLMLPIWKDAKIKITVDGGTDRWLQYLGPLGEEITKGGHPELIPTLITGDFDSILPGTLDKFRNLGASVIETPDQQYTDFSKALIELAAACKAQNTSLDSIYTFVTEGGRFDQIIGNINTLYKSQQLMNDKHVDKIILVSDNSLTWLLRSGKHKIKIPRVLLESHSWVGLIPFGCTANLSTTGLKWNLDDEPLAFGGMVSTSNTYSGSPEVTITTDSDIIWTMGIEPLLEMTNGCP